MSVSSFLSVIPISLLTAATCFLVLFFIWRMLGIPIIRSITRGLIPTLLVSAFLYFIIKMNKKIYF